jgi:hypothetical protein
MPPPRDAVSASGRSTRFKRLRLGILALGVVALLAFGGASFYDAWRSYRHVEIATDREISNVANALAEQTASTWQAVNLLLDQSASMQSSKLAPPGCRKSAWLRSLTRTASSATVHTAPLLRISTYLIAHTSLLNATGPREVSL